MTAHHRNRRSRLSCQPHPPLDDRPLEKRVGLIDPGDRPHDRARLPPHGGERPDRRLRGAHPLCQSDDAGKPARMQPSLAAGAALILPGEALDAICYSCTSASVVIGDAEIERAIHEAKPGVPVVTPPVAAVRGLRALGARRISVLTPYTVETSRPMADYFAGHGFDIDRFTCLGFDDDREMARITPASAGRSCACGDGTRSGCAVRLLHRAARGTRRVADRGGDRPAGRHQQSGDRLEVPAALRRRRGAAAPRPADGAGAA